MMKFGEVNLSALENVEIILVSIWKYGVTLHLSNNGSITIEGKAELKIDGKLEVLDGQDGTNLGTCLLTLLESKIISVAFDEANQKLCLVFDSNTELTLTREPDSPYESYQVGVADGMLVV
jgi:hypothetical protein